MVKLQVPDDETPSTEQVLKIVRTSMNPLVHYGFVKVIDLDNAVYDCRKLETVLHKTCHTMSWENLVAWKGKSEPPSIVPQVDDWQFWTELATQTIRKMHIKIPRKDYKAVVYGFSTVAWIMAQDYKKGGKLYEDGTAFLKKCMKDSVQRQMNMQQGFLSLTQKD
jgi:hypothetical protein